MNNRRILILCWLCFSILVNAQKTFWTPVNPPKTVYTLSVQVDTMNLLVKGNGNASFTNTGTRDLELVAVSFAQSGNSSMSVYQDNIDLKIVNSASIKTDRIYIFKLAHPAAPGEKITLRFEFHSGLDLYLDKRDNTIALQTRWYPKIWWDNLNTPDDYIVKLTLPSDYTIAMTGRYDKDSELYIGRNLRQLTVFLGKGYGALTKEVEGVAINVVYPPGGIKVAQAAFDVAVEAIPFYKKMYGSFPFPFFNIIPGSVEPYGGYNFAPGIAVIHGMTKYEKRTPLFWKWITAHEIGHHYWGESVYDGDNPQWIWIGLGIYTDWQFIQSKKMSSEIHDGFIVNNYFNGGVMKRQNTALEILPEEYDRIDWDYNNIVTHGKSFTVMSALESVIGHETMLATVKKCYEKFIWKRISWREFRSMCEEMSGQNLAWFFDEWVRSSNYLSFNIEKTTSVKDNNGEYNSTAELKNTGKMRMPVKVAAFFADGSVQEATISRVETNPILQFKSVAKLDSVKLDPEHRLPPLMEKVPLTKDDIKNSVNSLPWTNVGKEIADLYNSAVKLNFSDSEGWLMIGIRMYDFGDLEKTTGCMDKAISVIGNPKTFQDSTMLMSAYFWKGLIMDELGKRTEAIGFYNKALDVSTSFRMSFSQFGLVLDRESIKKYLKEPYKKIIK